MRNKYNGNTKICCHYETRSVMFNETQKKEIENIHKQLYISILRHIQYN